MTEMLDANNTAIPGPCPEETTACRKKRMFKGKNGMNANKDKVVHQP